MKRKMWAVPDRLFDILEDADPALVMEVLAAIRAYSHYWDEYQTDEGFDYDGMSIAAQRVFFRVYDEVLEANQKYFEKCQVLSENARAGVETAKMEKCRANRNKRYYEKNKRRICERMKKAYQSKSEKIKASEKRLKTSEKRLKNWQKASQQTSEEFRAGQAGSGFAGNRANAHRIIGLNNITSLCSEILLERGFGGKPSYPQAERDDGGGGKLTEKFRGSQFPTGSLSGSKAVQTGSSVPVCSKAEGQKGSEDAAKAAGREAMRQTGSPPMGSPPTGSQETGSKAVCGLRPGSARMDDALGTGDNPRPFAWLSAPHDPGPDEVRITKDFRIDFTDPVFAPYARADRTLRNGLEQWLRDKKPGCSVEKKWLAKQIVSFARNQGKLSMLMGVVDDG